MTSRWLFSFTNRSASRFLWSTTLSLLFKLTTGSAFTDKNGWIKFHPCWRCGFYYSIRQDALSTLVCDGPSVWYRSSRLWHLVHTVLGCVSSSSLEISTSWCSKMSFAKSPQKHVTLFWSLVTLFALSPHNLHKLLRRNVWSVSECMVCIVITLRLIKLTKVQAHITVYHSFSSHKREEY